MSNRGVAIVALGFDAAVLVTLISLLLERIVA
jgi:hypothetical protein